jgi:hypothetical protein
MTMKTFLKMLVAAGVLASAAAHAAATAYTDRATWESSADVATTITFEGGTSYVERGSSYTLDGVTFEANYIASIYDVGYDNSYHTSGYLDMEWSGQAISFGSGVYAFGFDFGAFYTSDVTLVVTLSDGSTFTVWGPDSTYTFFGITSDVPITGVWMSSDYPYLTIDILSLGAAVSGVPEPASPLLFGLGVIGLLVVRHRRKD